MTEPADARHWLSGEVNHHRTALSRPGGAVTARLIVGRVRDQNEKAAPGQGGLFPTWRYDNAFTDSPHPLMAAEGEHRDHAIVEHVLADLCDGPRRDPAPGPGEGLGPHRPPRPGPHHPPPPQGRHRARKGHPEAPSPPRNPWTSRRNASGAEATPRSWRQNQTSAARTPTQTGGS